MRLIGDMVSLATLPARLAWRVGGASARMLRDAVKPSNGNGATATAPPVVATPPPTAAPPEPASPPPAEPAPPVAPEPAAPAFDDAPAPAEPALDGDDPASTAAQPPLDQAPPRPAEEGPVHVDEGVELVEEFAETGAEDGAGAQISVDEPWEGYAGMTAADVRRRLGSETVEAAAAVQLYEAAHKGRSSVLEAAARRMRD